MKTVSVLVPSSFLLVIVAACSGSSTGTGDASDGGTSVAKGGQTAADSTGTPTNPAPTGKACSTADDCAYWYCECKDGAIVNSRQCSQGTCQGPKAHCDSACATFNHGPWTGQAGGGDNAPSSSSSSSSTSSSSSSSSGSSGCVDKSSCSAFSCGCTDGSRISAQDCLGGICQTASTGCENACLDDGRGDWDGT